MEYLMTYGWTILIIAVVLGVLFQMGVFSSANFLPKAQPGSCKVFRTTGIASLQGVCTGQVPQYAAQFNGQNSYINAGTGASLNIQNAITISAWINPISFPTAGNELDIVCKGYETSYTGYEFGLSSSGTLLFRINPTSSSWKNQNSIVTGIITNNWYYVVAVYDGTNIYFYKNGLLLNSMPAGGQLYSSSNKDTIGVYYNSGTFVFNGLIANVHIYNTSLDASQISALYLEGIGGAPIDPYHIVGWWPLNGDTNDYSGNNNNGAPTNIIHTSSWTSGYTQP